MNYYHNSEKNEMTFDHTTRRAYDKSMTDVRIFLHEKHKKTGEPLPFSCGHEA